MRATVANRPGAACSSSSGAASGDSPRAVRQPGTARLALAAFRSASETGGVGSASAAAAGRVVSTVPPNTSSGPRRAPNAPGGSRAAMGERTCQDSGTNAANCCRRRRIWPIPPQPSLARGCGSCQPNIRSIFPAGHGRNRFSTPNRSLSETAVALLVALVHRPEALRGEFPLDGVVETTAGMVMNGCQLTRSPSAKVLITARCSRRVSGWFNATRGCLDQGETHRCRTPGVRPQSCQRRWPWTRGADGKDWRPEAAGTLWSQTPKPADTGTRCVSIA